MELMQEDACRGTHNGDSIYNRSWPLQMPLLVLVLVLALV